MCNNFYIFTEMSRLSVVFVVVLVFLFVCSRANAQLNFSTGWGKRGLGSGATGVAGGDPVNCKTSVDSLMIIYKLIQVIVFVLLSYFLSIKLDYFSFRARLKSRSNVTSFLTNLMKCTY